MILLYSGKCGFQSAEESILNTEQTLPISQYQLLLSSLTSILVQAAGLILILNFLVAFVPGPYNIRKVAISLVRDFPYYFVMLQVVLSGFAFSYALKNGIAGGFFGGVVVLCAGYPFGMMLDYKLAYSIDRLTPMFYLVSIAAASSALAAIKLLSDVSDRKEKKTIFKLSLISFLLLAPLILSFASLTAFNLAARSLIISAEDYHIKLPAAIKPIATNLKTGYSPVNLLVRPYTEEVFFIDSSGEKNVLVPGNNEYNFPFRMRPMRKYLILQAVMNPEGEIWLLRREPSSRTCDLLNGTAKNGLKAYAVLARGKGIWLLGGERPIIFTDKSKFGLGQYYRCQLPGKGIVDCKEYSIAGTDKKAPSAQLPG